MSFDIEYLEELKKNVPMWVAAESRLDGMNKRGEEYDFICPWHADTNPSFQIYKGRDGVWLGHCKSCGVTKNIFQLIEEKDKISFSEAVKIVEDLKKGKSEWSDKKTAVDAVFQTIKTDTPLSSFSLADFSSYEDFFEKSPEAVDWITKRGVSLETAKRFHLGYTQKPRPEVVPSLHPWSDKGWILFPEIRDGRIVATKYRSIQGKRIKNGSQSWSGFAQRKDMIKSPLYNQDAITPFEDIFIVEGELDCMVLEQAGFSCVSLPSAGFSPTSEMRERLMSAHARFLAGDMDDAGLMAMNKLFKELGGESKKSKTYLIKWPKPCKDANQVFLDVCKGDVDAFKKLMTTLIEEAKTTVVPGIRDVRAIAAGMVGFKPPHENPNRLFFPWPNINETIAVLPGEVMLLAGTETKVGKTALIMNILVENIRRGRKVINFSAELTGERYTQIVAAHWLNKNRNSIGDADFHTLAKSMPEERLYVGYKVGAGFSEALKILTEAKQVYGGDIFVIDPLHFLIRGSDNENRDFAAAMKALVDFSIKWNVIVIVAGQTRKSASGNRGKIAQGQDIRGTAALGEDASTTWILHRDRVKRDSEGDETKAIFENVAILNLDYSRYNEPQSWKLVFNGATATFIPWSMEASPIPESDDKGYFDSL